MSPTRHAARTTSRMHQALGTVTGELLTRSPVPVTAVPSQTVETGGSITALPSRVDGLAFVDLGRVAERLNAPVLKSGRSQSRVSPGSADSWLS